MLSQGITIEWKPSLYLPAVIGKEQRLLGMFKQLIDNAIEAMSDRKIDYRELTIVTYGEKDRVICEITDTGPGIKPELTVKVLSLLQHQTARAQLPRDGLIHGAGNSRRSRRHSIY